MESHRLVILGAGPPNLGSTPASLRSDWKGQTTVEWLMVASQCSLSNTLLLAGFGADEIRTRFPDLEILEVSNWHLTGSLATLLKVNLDEHRRTIVAYSDVLLRPNYMGSLASADSDICVAIDSRWRSRYPGRSLDDLRGCEKVVLEDGAVISGGRNLDIEEVSGEFVGVMVFSPAASKWLNRNKSKVETLLGQSAGLSELLPLITKTPLEVSAVDIAGGWAEIRNPNDIAHFIFENKARTLFNLKDAIRSATIPPFDIVSVLEWEQNPEAVLTRLSGICGEQSLIIRSSSSLEDSFSTSGAGAFDSIVTNGSKRSVSDGIRKVIESYQSAGLDSEMQEILVQTFLSDVDYAGVVLSRTVDHHAPWCYVEFSSGPETNLVTSGRSSDTRTVVMSHKAMRHPELFADASSADLLDLLSPVLSCVAEVESLLDFDALDLEFALKGGELYLLQVRPVTSTHGPLAPDQSYADHIAQVQQALVLASENDHPLIADTSPIFGVMSDWNPAEMIGLTPGVLAGDLYSELITNDVWSIQRKQSGYQDLRGVPLMHILEGHAYIDVRASLASFIPRGVDLQLARRFLQTAIDRLKINPSFHDKIEFEVIPTCLDFQWSSWSYRFSSHGFDHGEIEQLRSDLGLVTRSILGQVMDHHDSLDSFVADSIVAFERRGHPLDQARSLIHHCSSRGTLIFAHLARAAFVSEALLRSAVENEALSADAADGFRASVNTVSKDLQNDTSRAASGAMDRATFYAKWSHLRPGTYDICSPTYGEDPARFLSLQLDSSREQGFETVQHLAESAWTNEREGFEDRLKTLLSWSPQTSFGETFRLAIEGRERAKFEFTRSLSKALDLIAEYWCSAGLTREEISQIPLKTLLEKKSLDSSKLSDLRMSALVARHQQRLAAASNLPPLICVPEDVEIFETGLEVPNFVGRTVVLGEVCLLVSNTEAPDLDGKVVLIESADPGFDWIFNFDLLALVTAYGGANSHMSIRAAEIGLPAAIGVGPKRFQQLATATKVEIDPISHTIRAID